MDKDDPRIQQSLQSIAQSLDCSPPELKHPYLYRCSNPQQSYWIKVRPPQFQALRTAFQTIREMNDPQGIIHKPLELIQKPEAQYWVETEVRGQPYTEEEDLSDFYRSLAALHRENQKIGSQGQIYTGMYADGQYFSSIADLILTEVRYHQNYLQGFSEPLSQVTDPLQGALGTIIHHDVHYGNLLEVDGRPLLLDTEYLCPSIHLGEFEHLKLFPWTEEYPQLINKRAQGYAQVYFEDLGLEEERVNELLRAWGRLTLLRNNTFSHFYPDRGTTLDLQRLWRQLEEYKLWPG
jgi:hypothetical protein